MQSTADKGDGIMYLNIWYGDEPNSFTYYEDDGTTYQYEEGKYYVRDIQYNPQEKEISMSNVTGDYSSKFKVVHLMLHGFPQNANFTVNGKSVNANAGKTTSLDFDNSNGKIEVKW